MKYHFSFNIFFQPLKSVKRILSSQAAQKQAVSQIWPKGHSLVSPVLSQMSQQGCRPIIPS